MKYWFFDGNDVVGPFEPTELLARPGFAATSLVCPENFSEDEDSWKLAGSFEDFSFASQAENPSVFAEEEPNTDSFDAELNTLLKQRNPLGVPSDEPTTEGSSLEIPKKPAKPGPIEEYFNNIKGEDLGNILGIPDPNENSDMDLARALKTQLGKTNPPADKEIQPIEDDPFDDFTSDKKTTASAPKESVKSSASAPKAVAPRAEKPSGGAPAEAPSQPNRQEEASVPMSHPEDNDFILTLRGNPPASANPPQEKEPEPEATQTVSSFQLPVLDQPVTEIPSLAQAETALRQLNDEPPSSEAKTAPVQPCPPAGPGADGTGEGTQPTPEESQAELEKQEEQTPVSADASASNAADPNAQTHPPRQPASAQDAPADPEPLEEIVPQPHAEASRPLLNAPEQAAPSPRSAQNAADAVSAPAPTAASSARRDTHPQNSTPEKEASHETVRKILEEGKLDITPAPEVPEPIKNVPVEPQLNQVRTRLKQTPEIQDFLRQTQNERLKQGKSYKKAMAALSVLVALLAVGAAMYINKTVLQRPSEPTPAKTFAPSQSAPDALTEDPAPAAQLAEIPVPPPPQSAEPSLADQAIAIVKNYSLPANRGTIASYLDRLYRTQKAQGYTASWSAESLHKSTYIVKYRLTKTRMEPLVYIFQVDVAQGKITGALNNITLDLVGKIQ